MIPLIRDRYGLPFLGVGVLLLSSLVACARPKGPSGDGGAAQCLPSALGLAHATPLRSYRPPEGCKWKPVSGSKGVSSAVEALAMLDCAGPSTLTFDFANESLWLTARILSPGSVGTDAYDDGTQITYVNRFRSSCAGEPLPMPMTLTYAYVLSDKGPRTETEKACSVESSCR